MKLAQELQKGDKIVEYDQNASRQKVVGEVLAVDTSQTHTLHVHVTTKARQQWCYDWDMPVETA
jgi:hypothetical protein